MSRSNVKPLLTVFFIYNGIVHRGCSILTDNEGVRQWHVAGSCRKLSVGKGHGASVACVSDIAVAPWQRTCTLAFSAACAAVSGQAQQIPRPDSHCILQILPLAIGPVRSRSTPRDLIVLVFAYYFHPQIGLAVEISSVYFIPSDCKESAPKMEQFIICKGKLSHKYWLWWLSS